MIGAIGSRAPSFITPGNLVEMFNDTAILIILALGQMMVLLTKGIDLSMAANLALTGMIVALLNAHYPGYRFGRCWRWRPAGPADGDD
jgi:rhamnose transport system permease protein